MMKRIPAIVMLMVLSFPGGMSVHPVLGKTPRATSIQPADNAAQNSMDTIRRIVQQPGVKQRLRKRELSDKDVKHRLTKLALSLNPDQKQQLAHKLTQIETRQNKKKQSIPAGKPFVGTTVDILTEILLIPVKILSFLIPGL